MLVLFAVTAFSTKVSAQNFTLDNQIPTLGINAIVTYCTMSTSAPSGGNSSTVPNTCGASLPCTVNFDLNGCLFTVTLSPCPTYGTDYVYSRSITTGCPIHPTMKFEFYYDGFTDDIIITIK